jgi:hypothetical protein
MHDACTHAQSNTSHMLYLLRAIVTRHAITGRHGSDQDHMTPIADIRWRLNYGEGTVSPVGNEHLVLGFARDVARHSCGQHKLHSAAWPLVLARRGGAHAAVFPELIKRWPSPSPEHRACKLHQLPKVGWQGVRLFPADAFTSGGLGSAMMAGTHEVWLCHYTHRCSRPLESNATFGEFCRQACAARGVPPSCGVNVTHSNRSPYSGCCGRVSCEQVACAECYISR